MAANVFNRQADEVLRYEVLEALNENLVQIKSKCNPHKPSGREYLEKKGVRVSAVISAWKRHIEDGNEVYIKNYLGQQGRGVWCKLQIDPDDQLTHYSYIQAWDTQGWPYTWVLDIHANDTGYQF
ncbi:hypothetical protein N8546_01745 [bacterium]|nr:hypothetical protein [bacterium]